MIGRNFEKTAIFHLLSGSLQKKFFFLLICATVLALTNGYVAVSAAEPSKLHFDFWIALSGVGLVTGAALSIALLQWNKVSVLILVFIIYGNLSEIGVSRHSLPSLVQILISLLLLGLFLRSLREGISYIRWDPVLSLLLVFSGLVFFSSLYAADTTLSDERLVWYLRGLLIVFVLVNSIRTPEHLSQVVWVLIITAGLLSAITNFQVATASYSFDFGGLARSKNAQVFGKVFEPRVTGPIGDPNFYAQILIIIVPLTLNMIWDARKLVFKLIAGVALFSMLLAIVFTFSRGGAVTVFFLLLFAAIYRRIKLFFILPLLIVVLTVIVIIPQDFLNRFETLSDIVPGNQSTKVKLDSSIQERALLMKTAWEIFKDHPFFGVGAGNYTRNYDAYSVQVGSNISSYEGFDERRFPHNLYLETAVELGLFGLAIIMLIGGYCLYYTIAAARAFSKINDHHSAGITAALALSVVGYAITSLFLHGDYLQYLWLIIALVIAAKQIAFRAAEEKQSLVSPREA